MTDSNALLQCAEQLLAAHGADDETVRRTIANRAYYGAYHACRDAVHRLQLPYFAEVSGGSHAREYKAMEACRAHHCAHPERVRALAYRCQRVLRPLRVHADYELVRAFSRDDMDQTLTHARQVTAGIATISQPLREAQQKARNTCGPSADQTRRT